jgi:hypothetical protein
LEDEFMENDLPVVPSELAQIIGVYASIEGENYTSSEDFIKLESRAKRNGYSILKQVLVDAIDKKIEEGRIEGIAYPKPDTYLSINMPCGSHVEYKTPNDIPDEDVPCPCGDPKHWMIKYRDLRPKD